MIYVGMHMSEAVVVFLMGSSIVPDGQWVLLMDIGGQFVMTKESVSEELGNRGLLYPCGQCDDLGMQVSEYAFVLLFAW